MRDELLTPDFPAPETNAANDDSLLPATTSSAAGREHWEQEKEKLTLALTERLLRGRDSVAFAELKRAPIFLERSTIKVGEMVLALLRQQARQIIRQEKPLVLQSQRRFELEDDDIRGQLRRLRDLLAERLVFDKNELQAAVAFAVRVQFDLLTKPGAALAQLIYSRSPQRRKVDIVVILEGLDEKHQLVVAIKNLLRKSPDGLIAKEEFTGLCQRATNEIYGAYLIPALIADLQAYQQFCTSLGPAASVRIHQQTVLQMLRERGLQELAEKALPELTTQRWWAVTDLASVLERALALPSLPQAAPIAPPVTEVELDRVLQAAALQIENLLAAAPNTEHEMPEPPPAAAQTALNLVEASVATSATPPISANGKEEEETVTAPVETSLATTPTAENLAPPESSRPPDIPPSEESEFEEVDLHAILQVEEATIPPRKTVYPDAVEEPLMVTHAALEAQPPGPYPSITRLIDGKSRQAFIKKVFHRDLDAYLDFIEALEATQTWKEAKALLDGTFKQRKVNPFSKEAVQMSDLVFSRYFKRGAK